MRVAVVVALSLLAATAGADDRPERANPVAAGTIVAIAADPKDVTRSVLVGPSGQAYDPDGGRWVRRQGGGVAADVSGAMLAGGELVLVGRATPMYRRSARGWFALRVGEDGRTVAGRGPTPAVAIGRHVFVHDGKRGWIRVGTAPGKVTALWASGKNVWAATDAAVFRLKGKAFAKAGAAVRAIVGGAPWGIGDDGLRHLPTGRTVAAELDGAPVTVLAASGSPGQADLWVVVEAAGKAVLAKAGKTGLTRVDDLPASGAVAAIAADGDGDVLVALADGTALVRTAEGWKTAAAEDDLPPASAGPGPSRTR